MFVPFDTLPDHARLWIYQSDRRLTAADQEVLRAGLQAFTAQWAVHGTQMETSFDIRHDRFVLLAANDQASGCSIDSSVRTVKTLGDQLGIDFFNRTQTAFLVQGDVVLIGLAQLKDSHARGQWNADTLMFNNLIDTHGALRQWLVPAGNTWLKRYLPQTVVTQ